MIALRSKMEPGGLPVVGIVDPCCPSAYHDEGSLAGLGGTEATVLEVARALSREFRVCLYQKARTVPHRTGLLEAMPLARAETDRCDAIVVVNSWKVACRLRARHPETPIRLWLHVFPGRHNRRMGKALAAAGIDVVCVSRSHASAVRAFLAGEAAPGIGHVWNPVAGLVPDGSRRDPNLLVFASAPHKGLSEVFARFADLRIRMPDLRLEVADPGYLRWDAGPVPDGATMIGTLDRTGVIARLRTALCLFYPQTTFRETFGLVMAEANAVGTPALVQAGLGANDEVAWSGGVMRDVRDVDALERTLRAWQADPPAVTGPEGFGIVDVAGAWRRRLMTMIEARGAPREVAHAG